MTTSRRRLIRDALQALGIRRFLLGIHDAAFPALPAEDVGRGSPASDGATELLELASSLGFDGIQLGPQGATSRSNASPYDGTLFSRNPLSVALAPLTRPEWGSLLRPEALARAVAERRGSADRVDHAQAFDAISGALSEAAAAFRMRRARGEGGAVAELAARLDLFRAANADWLLRDALHDALARKHGGASWSRWPSAAERELFSGDGDEARARREALLERHAPEVDEYAFLQLVAHAQHDVLRARARTLGLVLFGDLQVGISDRDAWFTHAFTLPGWRMGAPPSRTDPGGQPWGFAVLDPRRYFEPGPDGTRRDGPAMRFVRARAEKLFAEYDGLRIDHPHGLVCPWVYRVGGDPAAAVRAGARLFASPAVPDHPDLATFAIPRPQQLDPSLPRHADGWVRALDPEQVDRYAALFDVVMAAVPDPRDVACEILSTQPYPLRRVIERHGLGRFRVTQKVDLDRADDVYRSENARPEDWIMLGNHDTRPIWTVAEGWIAAGTARRHADHLATRLLPDGEDREDRDRWAAAVARDARALAQARFAELFVGPARNVVVYFTDLLGSRVAYNAPGTVSEHNWSLRVSHGVRAQHADAVAAGAALDVPRALARALRARGPAFVSAHRHLVDALEGCGRSPS